MNRLPVPPQLRRRGAFAVAALAAVVWLPQTASVAAEPAAISMEKPWTRWWWPGSAVDEQNITRELESFAKAGLGGVEITPIYGVKGAEDRYVPFLSERWMELLEHTGREARRLGLGVDMATGTGWPFGGPWVLPEDGILKLVHVNGRLAGEPTNMQVKRAAPGAEGPVVDPLSPAALERYLEPFSRAFASFPRNLVRAQFHDSFEYYESGWTAALPEKFREMHGYDIQDHAAMLLPAAGVVDAGPAGKAAGLAEAGPVPRSRETPATIDDDTLRRVKSDYRATLAQLHLEYLRTWVAWSHEHGFLVRNQSHGAPANLLDLYAAVDIPETETFGSTPFPIPGLRRNPRDVRGGDQDVPDSLVIKMASSAAHVRGRPLASSETCTWLREHWKVALSFAKPEIDRLFTDGINHILYHGTCYSSTDAAWPGWLFYASTQFNDRNPWWEDFTALNAYVTRVQSSMQSGEPDNDVLLYWPYFDVIDDPDGLMKQYGVHHVEWLRESPAGRMAQSLMDAGFSFDFISDEQIQRSRVNDGAISAPAHGYRAIVVPATRRMPVETISQLLKFQQDGAAVIFEDLPEDVPGLGRLEERRAQFHEVRKAIATSGTIGNVMETLVQRGAAREPVVETGLRFIRRAHAMGHTYFFTNLTDDAVNQWVTLGRSARTVLFENPLSGQMGRAATRHDPTGSTQVYLDLAPGESLLVQALRVERRSAEGAGWTYVRPDNGSVTVQGEWSVSFIAGGPEMPPAFRISELESWTTAGGEAAQRFAGTARYRLEFDLPSGAVADEWLLDLGDVRESARVRVNGVEAGTLWSLPFRVRIGKHLKPEGNVLEIDVTNLAANRIRDLDRRGVAWKIMHEINFVNISYRPFDASRWELTPSGLLGPVVLMPLQKFDPEDSE